MNVSRHALLLLCAALFPMFAFAGDGNIVRKARPVPNKYLVLLRQPLPDSVDNLLDDVIASVPAKKLRVYQHVIDGFALEMTDSQAARVGRLPFVESVEEVGEVTMAVTAMSWNTDRVDNQVSPRLDGEYSGCQSGTGVFVYVVDSGVFGGHSEFSNPDPRYPGLPRVRSGYDVIGTDGPPSDPCVPYRSSVVTNASHGTAVASIIAGRTMGAAPEATVVPIRVFNCQGLTNDLEVAAGLDWIPTDPTYVNGAGRIVNLSLEQQLVGHPTQRTAVEMAVQRLLDIGITVVVAAGNGNDEIDSLSRPNSTAPARMAGVITVAGSKGSNASDADERWNDGPIATGFPNGRRGSNFGPQVAFFAPADHVLAAFWSSSTAVRPIADNSVSSGTSFATALASGVAARYVSWVGGGVTPANVRQYLVSAASYGASGLNILDRQDSPNAMLYFGKTFGCRRRGV